MLFHICPKIDIQAQIEVGQYIGHEEGGSQSNQQSNISSELITMFYK